MSGRNKSGTEGEGPRPILELVTRVAPRRQLKPLQQRLLDYAELEAGAEPTEILYQHSVLCQTCLPYRDPGDEVRLWSRRNG